MSCLCWGSTDTGGAMVNFVDDGGAIPDDDAQDTCWHNGQALNKTLNALQEGDTFVVPANRTFHLMGGVIARNRIGARYMELSPNEYYMEGPFRLANLSVEHNTFSECAATNFHTDCTKSDEWLPLGYWCRWATYGGGCGGVCKAASVGASTLAPEACRDVQIAHNRA